MTVFINIVVETSSSDFFKKINITNKQNNLKNEFNYRDF